MKEDFDKYNKGHLISKAISELISENKDIKESETLVSFLSENENKKALLGRFENTDEVVKRREQIKSRNKEEDLKNLQYKLVNHTPKNRHLRNRLLAFTSSAAAIIILFVIIMSNSEKRLVTDRNLSEGVFVPTLFLDNGNTVALKSQNSNILGDNIKVYDRKISYEKLSSSAVEVKYNTLVIPKLYTYSVMMNDGTEIILNAGSQLKYPNIFVGHTREVELIGEAYFKVTKSDKPFIVKSNGVFVKVYGTEFNLRSTKENGVEAVLIRGKVGVKAENQDEVIMLPNTFLSYDNDGTATMLSSIDTNNYVSWLEDVFYYDEQKLSRILGDMSKWYGVTFHFGEKIGDTNVSMNMSRKTSIDDAIIFIENLISRKIIKEEKNKYSVE